jgi:glutathione synthase/RimK-type ligase-like ATP-grasp enzyme
VPFTLPEAVAARCVALSAALELPLCGIDLKHTPDGDWVCFEANPQPGFAWFDVAEGAPIAAAVAALLAR